MAVHVRYKYLYISWPLLQVRMFKAVGSLQSNQNAGMSEQQQGYLFHTNLVIPHKPSQQARARLVNYTSGYRVNLKLDCLKYWPDHVPENRRAMSVSFPEINEWLIAVVNSSIKHNFSVCLRVSLLSLQITRLAYSQTVRAITLCHHQLLECKGCYRILKLHPFPQEKQQQEEKVQKEDLNF